MFPSLLLWQARGAGRTMAGAWTNATGHLAAIGGISLALPCLLSACPSEPRGRWPFDVDIANKALSLTAKAPVSRSAPVVLCELRTPCRCLSAWFCLFRETMPAPSAASQVSSILKSGVTSAGVLAPASRGLRGAISSLRRVQIQHQHCVQGPRGMIAAGSAGRGTGLARCSFRSAAAQYDSCI